MSGPNFDPSKSKSKQDISLKNTNVNSLVVLQEKSD